MYWSLKDSNGGARRARPEIRIHWQGQVVKVVRKTCTKRPSCPILARDQNDRRLSSSVKLPELEVFCLMA